MVDCAMDVAEALAKTSNKQLQLKVRDGKFYNAEKRIDNPH